MVGENLLDDLQWGVFPIALGNGVQPDAIS